MSDFQRNGGQDLDEDRLPWLEPVDDYDDEDGISIGRLIGAVVVGLVALGLVIGGIFWLRNRDNSGDGTLIAAPEGPIKEKPGAPGGMEVDGAGDVAYDASVGRDVNSTIDLSALPETPITEGGVRTAQLPASTAQPAPPPAKTPSAAPPSAAQPVPPKSAPAKPAPVKAAPPAPKPLLPAPAPAASSPSAGGAIQLGAFSSAAQANKAWSSLAGRFGFLSGMEHGVNSVTVGGKTLYRLRANAGGQAGSTCAKLKVAGEACAVVD